MEDESANNAKAAAVIASLANKNSSEPRGVRVEQGVNNKSRGAIRRDDEGNGIKDILQVKATLTTTEVARYKKIFSIFKSVVAPGPEAETLQSAKLKRKLPVQLPRSSAGGPGKGEGSWLKKLIGPALLILGGLSALITGLFSDGAATGLLKILAKVGIGGGVKWFASKFKGIGKSVGKMFKSFGGILLKPFKFLKGGAIKTFFKGMGNKVGILLKPILKRIPGIGSMISWAFAYSRFKKGDTVGGLIDVASGIATLFPGIGTALGIGLDVLNAFLDTKKGDETVKPAGSGFNMGDFFGNIKDKIMNNYPVKNLMEFWSGAADIAGGDVKGGLQRMAFAIPFAKPLADWLFGATNEETGQRAGGGAADVFKNIRDLMLRKFINTLPEGYGIRSGIAEMLGVNIGNSQDKSLDTGYQINRASRRAKENIWGSVEESAGKYQKVQAGIKGTGLEDSDEWRHIQGAIPYLKRLRKQHEEYTSAGNTSEATRIQIEMMKREQWKQGAIKGLYDKLPTEMQDFIVQDGKITPFSNKDSVLGMKTGGAIDKLVNKQNEDIKRFSGQLVKIALEHTQILRDIAINTRNSSGGTTVVNAGNNAMSKPRTVGVRDAYTS